MSRTRVTAFTSALLMTLGVLSIGAGAQAVPGDVGAAADTRLQPDVPDGETTPDAASDVVIDLTGAADVQSAVPEETRDEVLGNDWEASRDRAWMVAGDADGFHVLVADAAEAYAWRTVATLAQPGFDTDRWIGNACVTESGERLVVSYAPRGFTNETDLFLRGAFTAVVDLATGTVTDVPVRSSIEYFSPSCGNGEEALITISGGDDANATRIATVDAATATVEVPVEVEGQVTSAVLTDQGIVAAAGPNIVIIEADGSVRALARATSVPFRLAPDGDGGVVFLDHDGETSTVRRLDRSRIERPRPHAAAPELATGPLTELGLTRTAGGLVMVTGQASRTRTPLPATVAVIGGAKDAEASILGDVTMTVTGQLTDAVSVDGSVEPSSTLSRIDVLLESRVTGESEGLSVLTAAAGLFAPKPGVEDEGSENLLLSGSGASGRPGTSVTRTASAAAADAALPTQVTQPLPAGVATGDPNNPLELERTCSVPRNDPANQAMQPKPRQVEWAVNQAVKGVLTVQREANWKNLGMAAYKPQVMFPPAPLAGGGEVPSQIVLGILAQESNLWQAPGHVVPGVTGNPLIGNYYGLDVGAEDPNDRWAIDWSESDCGYGVAQVTDGMRRNLSGGGTRSYAEQRAIALDFAANVAAGLQILQQKWNETRAAGLIINNGNPARIENWYYAIWAYNSGFYPEEDRWGLDANGEYRNGEWGVGWANNPANPSYLASRAMFHEDPYDATHPQDWPYPEKVIGFAAYPPSLLESSETFVAAYRAAWWPGEGEMANANRRDAKPPVGQFCDESNDCDWWTSNQSPSGYDWGPCEHKDRNGDYDGRCWYHEPSTWKVNCDTTCGRPFLRFVAGYAYQADGTAYPSSCSLPAGALVIDDVPDGAPVVRTGCTKQTTNSGAFSLTFSSDGAGNYPSKIDFHQLGAGYGGHFWFGHTRNELLRGGSMEVTGTWTLGRSLNQWARVMVHLPDHGAHTQQATYRVNLGDGHYADRTILQRTMTNGWVSLGVFQVNGTPSVTLSTETKDGDGPVSDEPGAEMVPLKNEDIAFDAVAFVPLAQRPTDIVVALGDSYSSGEGGSRPGEIDYYPETDNFGDNPLHQNGCHRSPYTWSRLATLPGSIAPVGARADALDPMLDYHLLACSGAIVDNLLKGGEPQFNELPQLDRGFLDENTTLVTLSVGGNDSGFASIITTCLLSAAVTLGPCRDLPANALNPLGASNGEALPAQINGEIQDSIVEVLGEIHQEAPNAQVVLMGYPELFASADCFAGPGAFDEDVEWLNEIARVLDVSMGAAVVRANGAAGVDFAKFTDPRPAFSGRGICQMSPEYIHGFVQDKTPGEATGPFTNPVSQQSFHPTIVGYQAYADVLNAGLLVPGSISGRVTGPDDEPRQATVVATAPGGSLLSTTTDADGHYTLQGLVSGSYTIEFQPTDPTYARQYYDWKNAAAEATTVNLAAGAELWGVDSELWYAVVPPLFSDVTASHPFLRDIHWAVIRSIEASNPAGPFNSTSSVTREVMAAWLYRLAGRPAYTPPATPPFTDVGTGHQYYKEICWLATQTITNGWPTSDGRREFRPTAAVERQAMAAFLYRYAGSPDFTDPATSPFADLRPTDPFYHEVTWMVSEGITTGFSDGTFRPVAAVERQAMVAFLHRLARNVLGT